MTLGRGVVKRNPCSHGKRKQSAVGTTEKQQMGNSYLKINIHLIFHVKSTGQLMRESDLPRIFQYIEGIIKSSGGIPIQIGGLPDHIHILTTLPKDSTVPDFVRNIKAESSRWMKTIDSSYRSFSWQEGYGAFSVSASTLSNAIRYIDGQAEHHSRKSFLDEYKEFLNAYKIEYDERFVI